MMTSSRPRDVGGSFASRRGHAPQLSISDPSHHVTEAIGTMYGDSDDDSGPDSRRESRQERPPSPSAARKGRPLSFLASPAGGEQIKSAEAAAKVLPDARQKLARSTSEKAALALTLPTDNEAPNRGLKKSHTMPIRASSKRVNSSEGPPSPGGAMSPMSPTLSLRDVQEAESSQFPLGNIENPSDIAQELSNLQALRRMSMDVGNNSDPDLLPFSGISLMAMPTVAPTGEDDEGDLSRLLWVPAKVHPELAPDQFKNFLEDRVKTIKRRSGDSMLSTERLERNNSGSLRRKKSMLSRQIDSAGGNSPDDYVDGAERLERKLSASGRSTPELSLNELVKDPTKAVQKLTQESQEAGATEDMPILPIAPGMGLRRSTRTTYRKGGSLRSGDRLPFSKRAAAREAEKDAEKEADDQTVPPVPKIEAPPGHTLTRVQTEPVSGSEKNFSRPTRSVRRQQPFQRDAGAAGSLDSDPSTQPHADETSASTSTSLRPGSSDRPKTSDSSRSAAPAVPQIVETPPAEENDDPSASAQQPSRTFPERSSSQKTGKGQEADQPPPPRSLKRPSSSKSHQPTPSGTPSSMEASKSKGHSLDDLSHHPSPLPGGGATRTDSLAFIPTLPAEEREKDKEKRKSKEKDEGEPTKSTAWNKWFRGEDREKKKKEKEEQAKKARSRTSAEKGHDTARLDVLQNSIDNALQKGRESLLLDRDSVDNKLLDERKKESSRKSSDGKKEKDGFFGSIFGGKSRKADKDGSGSSSSLGGRGKQRALSPEPPPRQLVPDVDYPYTRFPIVEERAIYRMAHIKLANPRRSLLSQVLLSNFMYSYLAKVQAMHPQLNVPVSPQQKRQEEERKRREQEQQQHQQQQYLQEQQMQDAEQDDGQNNFDRYNFEYHRSSNQYGDPQQQEGSIDYIDDSQIYEYEHGGSQQQQQQQKDGSQQAGDHQNEGYRGEQNGGQGGGGGGRQGRQYYEYEQHGDGRRRDDDMW